MNGPPGLRLAVTMFTIVPLPDRTVASGARSAAAAVPWLPVIGLLLGLGASLIAWLIADPLAATLIVVLWAVATGGLHLDGLADTADGLGSRRPAAEALKIMKRPDIGPFGVAALVLTLLVQVAALISVVADPILVVLPPLAGRVAVVLACGSPSARPGGFGDLVAGALTPAARHAIAGAAVVAGTACAFAVGSVAPVIAVIGGLGAAMLLLQVAIRRLGGTTGDVFGALIELATTVTLVLLALLR